MVFRRRDLGAIRADERCAIKVIIARRTGVRKPLISPSFARPRRAGQSPRNAGHDRPARTLIQGLNKSQYASTCVCMGVYCVVCVVPCSLCRSTLPSERRLAGSGIVGVHSR